MNQKETRFLFDKKDFLKLLNYFKNKFKKFTTSYHINYYFPKFRLRKGNYSNQSDTVYYVISETEQAKIIKKKEKINEKKFKELLKKYKNELKLITKSKFYEFNNYKYMLEKIEAIKKDKKIILYSIEIEDYKIYDEMKKIFDEMNIKYKETTKSLKSIILKEIK